MKTWIEIDVMESLRSLDDPGSEGFSANLYAVYQREADSCLAKIHRAIAAKDFSAVQLLAHRLTEMALSVGAHAVHATVEKIEAAAVRADAAECSALTSELRADVGETRKEIAYYYPAATAA